MQPNEVRLLQSLCSTLQHFLFGQDGKPVRTSVSDCKVIRDVGCRDQGSLGQIGLNIQEQDLATMGSMSSIFLSALVGSSCRGDLARLTEVIQVRHETDISKQFALLDQKN